MDANGGFFSYYRCVHACTDETGSTENVLSSAPSLFLIDKYLVVYDRQPDGVVTSA